MEILKPANTTRILAEGQDEYLALPIIDSQTPEGVPIMLSCHRPTEEELKALNNGGYIVLGIHGTLHPPVCLYVVEDD